MTVKISSMTATFNDAANTYTAVGMDVTDTASAANSALLNLKVGGTSKFAVNKNGTAFTNAVVSNTANVNTLNATTANVTTLNVTTANVNVLNAPTVNATTVNGKITIQPYNGIGSPGQLAWDANTLYVCVATNTWKTVALV